MVITYKDRDNMMNELNDKLKLINKTYYISTASISAMSKKYNISEPTIKTYLNGKGVRLETAERVYMIVTETINEFAKIKLSAKP